MRTIIMLAFIAAQAQPAFEVASIRRNDSGPPQSRIGRAAGPGSQIEPLGGQITLRPGGRFTATNATLIELLRAAYAMEALQIAGGPRWIASDRFDVAATAPAAATEVQVRSMLQALLRDRFSVVAHMDTRAAPGYALVSTGSGSARPRLRPSGPQCAPMTPTPQVRTADMPAPPPPPPVPLARPASAGTSLLAPQASLRCPSMFVQGDISAREITMDQLAERLAALVKRPVVNRTGLAGAFDVDLAWSAELQLSAPATGDTRRASSLFSALEEQLGLRLESRTVAVEVLVVDRAEPPTPN
jgi:uncharacterized protein (TIGR03435 family)